MSTNSEPVSFGKGAFGEAADAYAKFWSDVTSKMIAAAFAASPGSAPPQAAREVRTAMLRGLSESCDQYMRSPQFQDALKQWFANSIHFRAQTNDWYNRVRHESQGVSRQDIDALVEAIGRLEAHLSDGLQRLAERLDALETKSEAPAPSRGAEARPARPVRGGKSKR